MSNNQEHVKHLQRLQADLYSQMPLIGGWLRREAAQTLAEGGSPDAITTIGEALFRSKDPNVQGLTLKALLKWAKDGNLEAQETLCRVVIEREDPFVRDVVIGAGYTPRDLRQRALLYLLTEQWERYEHLDFDHHLLNAVYPELGPQVRKRIAECVRRAGHVEWLTVIAGERQKKRLNDLTVAEWETALLMLQKNQNWEETWQLAQAAPAVWSARLLLLLKSVAWLPTQEVVRTVFSRLVSLAEDCDKEGADILTKPVNCYATLEGNARDLEGLAISPDGKILASGGWDKAVRLWSLPDGELLKTLKGSKERITCLMISPDNQILASSGLRLMRQGGAPTEVIQLWNLRDGTKLHTLKGHTEKITCLAISPDGQRIISGSEDHTVRGWNLSDGRLLYTLTDWNTLLSATHQPPSHNGRFLARRTITADAMALPPLPDTREGRRLARRMITAKLQDTWLLPDEICLPPLEGLPVLSGCLALSPDERMVAASGNALFDRSGGRDKIIQVWRLLDGAVLHTLQGHTHTITALAFSPDGKLLVSGGYDKTIRVWSLADGEMLETLNVQQSHPTCLVVSPDGRLLANGNHNGMIHLWDLGVVSTRRLLLRPTNIEDLTFVENLLQAGRVTALERIWLQFTLELMHWQRRFDVEVGERLQGIPAGEFDIELG